MSSVPNWTGVAEFVCVAESGSFTAAAKRLGVSTAQVSRQVSRLEQRLATQLLYRTTRKVRVSELGQRYYRQCRLLMDGFETAENDLQAWQTTPRGRLDLTAPIRFGEQTLMPLVNDFQRHYPEMILHVELTNTQLDIIEAGYDLAIRLGRLPDSRLRARKLAMRQVLTCCSPEYLRQWGQPHTPGELKHHNCLLGSVGQWRFREGEKERTLSVRGSLRCNSGRALLDAARKGIGIVQLPEEYVQADLSAGLLVEVLTPFCPDSEGIWGLYPNTRWISPNVGLLLNFLGRELSELNGEFRAADEQAQGV